jgi:hypothetical protein
LRDGEFRCIAAKALDYISFCDKSAASVAGAPSVYLKPAYEKRGCRTQWRISNILERRRILSWTASRRRVTISETRDGNEQSPELRNMSRTKRIENKTAGSSYPIARGAGRSS